jgi:hypothetical protein
VGNDTVHYHGFAGLSVEQDESVDSPKFLLLGNGIWNYIQEEMMTQQEE